MQSHQGHTCANCGQTLSGKYCAQCGQPADTHRINFHYLWHDFQHGFFHFDKGVLYTVKQLFTRPGHAIREFLEGKRIRHFKPFSLVILLATVYALLYHFFHLDMTTVVRISSNTSSGALQVKGINDWLNNHYALSTLLLLPFLALFSYLAFLRKKGYNYLEHLVLTAFLTAQRLAVRIVLFPLIYFLKGTDHMGSVLTLITLINTVLFFWTYLELFYQSSWFKVLLRCLLYGLLLLIGVIILALIIGAATGSITAEV